MLRCMFNTNYSLAMPMILSEHTSSTPLIEIIPKKGCFLLKGRSMPENPAKIFGSLVEYTKKYSQKPAKNTRVIFDLEFINSTSLKYITLFLHAFQLNEPQAETFTVVWKANTVEHILPPGKSYKNFFSILCENISCKKRLIVKTKSELSDQISENQFDLD